MLSPPLKTPATDVTGALDGRPDLLLSEVVDRCLWSIQSSKALTLDTFARTVFNRNSKMGSMQKKGGLRLVQLWPDKAYLLSNQFQLPGEASDFAAIATDISHAYCELSLSGGGSLSYLNAYTTADLEDETIRTARCVRTRLGRYPITLWWDSPSDIRILVDRSYALSISRHFENLAQRWY